ncbi:13473_t:CDS:10 [Entrophospora sp. SA101]|nr:13473_t:CDS:10 [Entrophospora sp. SA101]
MIEKQSLFVFTFFTLLILNSLSIIEAATVIGIDYGTDWFKVSIVKPGIPLNIVLNRDSKRKTQSVITIRDDERLYGADAVNIGARVPSNTYFSLKRLLGRVVDDKYVQEYKSNFPNKIIKDPIRGTVLFQHNETTTFSVEELVAMQLSHAKKQAEVTAQEEVKDSVITVPPYYNQFERQAILDAAEIAGLRVLSLINDLTAVGINYAITHSSSITEDPQIHLFYDMGAGSTKASVIKFNIVNNKDAGPFNKTFINLEVLSTGYDRTLGGQEFDLRLRKYFATKFDNLHSNKLKESIFKSDRAMTKLFKEANRVKQILSANTETIASIENLHEEKDFRIAISRNELESITNDLIGLGGGIRVPAVQNMLKGLIGEDKIAQNLNGDEAAVLGAGFRGAGLSHHFKVKEVKVTDITSYPTEFANQSEKNINENDISVDVDNVDIKPLGEKEKLNSIQRLLAMERIDNERHARERAMNYLESYVYKYQDFLDEPIVIQVTTVEQRSELSKKLSETSDWLYGEGENAPTDEFHLRLDTLRLLEKPISFRQEEFIKRPDAISSLELLIDNTRGFIEQIRTNITVETWHYTDADIDKLLNVCDKIENWLKEKLAEQGKTALYIDPIFTTDDIQKKVNEIKREFLKLVNKKPPIKAKSSTTTTATTESVKTNDTTADSITQETSNVTIPSDTETTTEAIEPKTTHQEL